MDTLAPSPGAGLAADADREPVAREWRRLPLLSALSRRLSIRQKILALVALVTTGALVSAFAVHTWADVRGHRRELVDSSLLVARVVGENMVPGLAFDDARASADGLHSLESIPSMRGALLFDLHGRRFASWGAPVAVLGPLPDRPTVRFLADGLHVVQPIVFQGKRDGTLALLVATDELRAKITRDVALLAVVLLATLIAAIGVTYRLQRVISEPIQELARTTRRVTLTGDTSLRVRKVADDEIGALYDGFNDMLDQIQKRERERDAAEHRTQEKTRFLANMSHELRTPLNSIIGFSEILLAHARALEPRERKFLGNIHTSGRHLLTIINDILDLSKVEEGRMELQPEIVAVPQLLDGVCTIMKGVADHEGISIDVELEPDLPPIWADALKVKQVLYNLLSNAVKFSPPGSRVGVAVRALDAMASPLGETTVEVAVRDHGIGIAPENHRRIFAPFQQVDSGAGRRFGGTGLGLALVETFVEMHGGVVTLDSALGRGSEFRVLLPVRASQVPQGAQAVPLPVLVVEDDREVFERLAPLLERAGFAPVLARTGEAALALARSVAPAAVVLDLVLPGMVDGWEVLKSLKADPATARIPIVIASRQENRELGLALGADDYFLKPMDLVRLVARLRALVTREPSRRPAVLLVDDDRSVHQLLEPGLTAEGYELLHAYSAEEGLAKARATPPALVVLDLLMDRARGLALAFELRALPETARVPLVLLAGHDPSEEERAVLRRQAPTLFGVAPDQALPEALRRLLGPVPPLPA